MKNGESEINNTEFGPVPAVGVLNTLRDSYFINEMLYELGKKTFSYDKEYRKYLEKEVQKLNELSTGRELIRVSKGPDNISNTGPKLHNKRNPRSVHEGNFTIGFA